MAQDPYRYFRVEARELVDQLGKGLLDLEKGGASGEMVAQLLRLAHTLKGAARVVKQPAIADHAHAIEGVLEPFRGNEPATSRADDDQRHPAASRRDRRRPRRPFASRRRRSRRKPRRRRREHAAAPRRVFRTVRTEVEEIDALVDGVSETFARLNALRDTVERGRARRPSRPSLLAAQLAARGAKGQLPAAVARGRQDAGARRGASRASSAASSAISDPPATAWPRAASGPRRGRAIAPGPGGRALHIAGTGSTRCRPRSRQVGDVRSEGRRRAPRRARAAHRAGSADADHPQRRRARHRRRGSARLPPASPPPGASSLQVARRGRRVVFRCEDDGRGVDLEAVRAAARRRGLPAAEIDKPRRRRARAASSSRRPQHLRRRSPRSPAAASAWTSCAKRSTGSAARSRSAPTPGRGTTFELIVPLSLAAVEALVVESAGMSATIPLDCRAPHAAPRAGRHLAKLARRIDRLRRQGHTRSCRSRECCAAARRRARAARCRRSS